MSIERYVPLRRSLREVNEDSPGPSLRRFFANSQKGWNDFVPARAPADTKGAVVVVAPSGMGKSAELRAHAARLQSAGIPSFFMRALDLMSGTVQTAVNDPLVFAEWRASAARAVFFIDAVDEARLAGCDLGQLLQRFALDVDAKVKEVQLVLSTRNEAWSWEDERCVVRALALRMDTPPIKVVRLEPLTADDLREYAAAQGVQDVDAFLSAFVDEDLDTLVGTRPVDALILIKYWTENGRFGTWSEMLLASIYSSLRDENQLHYRGRQFTREEALAGLTRVAAATVLTKRSLVSESITASRQGLDLQALFADWRPRAVSQLLALGLFQQKGHHSFQLTQDTPTHFLAAMWLGERVRLGWSVQALESELFMEPFRAGRVLTPGSRSAVLGWVAGFVPELRRRLMDDHPQVLLFEGDPSKLARGEVAQALRGVVRQLARGGRAGPTRGTVLQIAKHDVESVVRVLLLESDGAPEAQRLLLRIAEAGRYRSVAPVALTLALASDGDDAVRSRAISVVSLAGTSEDREQLLSLADHANEEVRLALVRALAPTGLLSSSLADIVLKATNKTAFLLTYALKSCSTSDLDIILSSLLASLSSSVVDASTKPRVTIASQLVADRLGREVTSAPPWMVDLLLALERHLENRIFVPRDTEESMKGSVALNVELRRDLWCTRARRAPAQLYRLRLSTPLFDDVLWLWSLSQSLADEHAVAAVRFAIHAITDGVSPEQEAALDVPHDLAVYLEQRRAALAEHALATSAHEARLARKSVERRHEHTQIYTPRLAAILAGTDIEALAWACSELRHHGNEEGRVDLGRLRDFVTPEVVDAFASGFQRYWRLAEPSSHEPEEGSFYYSDIAALMGITLEIDRGLNLSSLSAAEVERAVQYSVFEFNGKSSPSPVVTADAAGASVRGWKQAS